jgi:hypothetical protein
MDVGQRVQVIKSIDTGKGGEIVGKHTKLVPVPILRVGGDDKPVDYCTVKLDDGHTNLYPSDWVEALRN